MDENYFGKGNDNELNKSMSERLAFWEQFNQVLVSRGKPFNVRKATTDHWYDVAIGTSEAHISISLINKDGIPLFDTLHNQKDEIEEKLGFELIWDRIDGKKASRIKYYIQGLDFDDHSNYDALMNQSIDAAVKMRDVFKKYI